jgi:hypothetical protein
MLKAGRFGAQKMKVCGIDLDSTPIVGWRVLDVLV